MSEYEAQAQMFLDRFGLSVVAAFKGDECPTWDDPKHIHGDRYRVTIRRRSDYIGNQNITPKSISFDFWNSKANKDKGERPTAYDILATISGDASGSTDPDEVAAELGDMKPSQAIAIARFAAKLQKFFRPVEIDALAEIQ